MEDGGILEEKVPSLALVASRWLPGEPEALVALADPRPAVHWAWWACWIPVCPAFLPHPVRPLVRLIRRLPCA